MRRGLLAATLALTTAPGIATAQLPPQQPGYPPPPGAFAVRFIDMGPMVAASLDQPAPPADAPAEPLDMPKKATPTAGLPDGFVLPPPPAGPPAGCLWYNPPPAASNPCLDQTRFWTTADLLLWVMTRGPLPPLVTPGPAVGFANVGPRDADYGLAVGLRTSGGVWLGENKDLGLETGGFILSRQHDRFAVASDPNGNPLLARPFFDPTIGAPNALLISAPGAFAGGLSAESASQLLGGEANLVSRMIDRRDLTVELLAGFRYLDLREDLKVISNTRLLPGGVAAFNTIGIVPPDGLLTYDEFDTRNQFYGGQVGARFDWTHCDWVIGGSAKVALGVMQEQVRASGTTTLFSPLPAPMTVPGGFLAVDSNSVRTTQNRFAVSPEVGVKVGYRITDKLTATVGYDLLYVSSVVRPGDQTDLVINPAHVPASPTFGQPTPPTRPGPLANASDFFAHGVSLGVAFVY